MRRRFAWLVFAFALACEGTSMDGGGVEPADERKADDKAEEEQEAEEIPERVQLADEVIRDAGIAWTRIERRRIRPTISLFGEVVADPGRRARVAARLPGVVDVLPVEPGARVAAGDVIAKVRAPDVQSLRAEEASLRARSASARANAERLAALAQTRMASAQELLAARAEAEALEAARRGARDRLRAIGVSRSARGKPIHFEVRAPIDGVLTERHVFEGDPVTPETVVGTIVALDEVWFLGHVYEHDVGKVREGAAAKVELNAFPDRPWPGVVQYLSHQVDPSAATLSARIPLRNDDGLLRLGLFGNAAIEVGPGVSDPVPCAPRSAITTVLGRSVAFVRAADGAFERRHVTLGASDLDFVEIRDGIDEGEVVVTEGVFAVKSAMLRSTFGEEEEE